MPHVAKATQHIESATGAWQVELAHLLAALRILVEATIKKIQEAKD